MATPKKDTLEAKLPKKLVRSLRSVQKYILEHPKQFDMKVWAKPIGEHTCGTIGCIAGHMAMQDTPKKVVKKAVLADFKDFGCADSSVYKSTSTTRLGRLTRDWRRVNIPYWAEDNFNSLFAPGDDAWSKFKTKKGNITAEGAARRIDHFLLTGN